MKILLVSKDGVGAWFTLRLMDEGHDVDYYLLDNKYENVLRGIAPEPFFKKPDFGKYDLVVFDVTGNPELAEESRLLTPTLGDSEFATCLEDDRQFGISTMEQVGINVPPYEMFSSLDEARRFVEKTNKRYVFKPFTEGEEQSSAATYVSESAEDLLKYFEKLGSMTHGVDFLLQEVVHGVECSIEGWFNGEDFYFVNATIEEKKFMNANKGPNTGCAGNLVWCFGSEPALFTQGLGRMKDFLRENDFRGMIDLNTIVSDRKIYGLEWTPRFGYDASSTIFSLYRGDLGKFWHDIASGNQPIDDPITGEFAAAVRMSIPPYPSEVEGEHPDGVPIQGLEPEDITEGCYMYDAMLDEDDELVTAGVSGFVASPIGRAISIDAAFCNVHDKLKKIKIPDAQYRTDVKKSTEARYLQLQRNGWFK